MPKKSTYDEYLDAWRQFKEGHPLAYTIGAIAPVTGQAAAVADYAEAMDRGDRTDAATAAVSLIPGIKLAKTASKLAPASIRLKSQMNGVEKAIAPIVSNSQKIGQAAAAEQVAEYAAKQYKDGENQRTDMENFAAAWAKN